MRNIGIMAASVALIGLTACNPADDKADAASAPAQAAAPQPSQMMQETFVNCTWGETQGSGLSVWSYACPQAGNTHMVHDASLPGFALEGTYDGQTSRSPTIIVFKKAADAPIDAVLAEIRTRSPGPHTAQCVLARPTYDGVAEGIYHLVPPEPIKARWEAFSSGDGNSEPMDPPCGDLGEQMSGDHVFYVQDGDPTTVLWVNFGSEIQPFTAESIRPLNAG
ncbi:MAG: hypothetical protein B7Y86_14335 [Brevundimonas subvibrioides]|uniref:Lipoprotein n=1 Tax=Brevundimonas subvibrioides TaxID=74313 RepID=A0A258HFM3_9CAUL|nr:hypothetical protein [Brevundimonas subvibrioides]OYX55118.1 MAG: hypothetical protein B7Y86_14335 [Brevundimonas subvibrioides]